MSLARAGRSVAGIGMTSQRTRARMVERLREQGITDARVLEAMAAVPRHLFVEEALASRAYEDTALPIGFGQTISQPFVVARMIEIVVKDKNPGKYRSGRRLRLPGCGARAARGRGVLGRAHPRMLERALEPARAAAEEPASPTATARQTSPGRHPSIPSSLPPRRAGGPGPLTATRARWQNDIAARGPG
jgi:hypothetical protein